MDGINCDTATLFLPDFWVVQSLKQNFSYAHNKHFERIVYSVSFFKKLKLKLKNFFALSMIRPP